MAIKLSNYAVIDYNMLYIFKIIEALLDKRDHGNQQNPPFSKLQIEQLEQFEGSRTFTNFIEPILPKNRTEQPWLQDVSSWHP